MLKVLLEDDRRQKGHEKEESMQLPVGPDMSTTVAIRLTVGIGCRSEGLLILRGLRGCVYTRESLRITLKYGLEIGPITEGCRCTDGNASWQYRPRGSIAPPRWSAEPRLFCYVHFESTRADIQRFDNVLESSFHTALHHRTYRSTAKPR